ncbi:MAG: DUF3035 domain-containing protein [Rhodospirillaceae bacterium]|nr:DUF3035 domain-containing protein [Rhodospirillales bacterium]MBT4702012.1 DUF3035 domain-containing protein [Rhodospirillaceae bacterium]MBT5034728.1 DUF3035 domain-containing protein [Rhodospirillaceae bacterium]MBT6221471.1 DUF3035 domain-containing protein [Rhodospirillaceae bacterium]MBT6363374.1 DUF3035 domain-containing protein [Rhodospirillaceae bacterium]
MRKIGFLSIFLVGSLLSGCDSISKAVLNKKSSPDEFSVYTRAPLSIPRDFGLKAPKPGTTRPQEVSPRSRAKVAVMGRQSGRAGQVASNSQIQGSRGVMVLLRDTGSLKATSDIRKQIDAEADDRIAARASITDRLLFWEAKQLDEVVVHPLKEAHRIKQAVTKGKKVTGSGSVTISRQEDPNRSFLSKLLFD